MAVRQDVLLSICITNAMQIVKRMLGKVNFHMTPAKSLSFFSISSSSKEQAITNVIFQEQSA